MTHILLELKKIELWLDSHGESLNIQGIHDFKDLILTGNKIDLRTTENSYQHPGVAENAQNPGVNTTEPLQM